ncbi:MAG TPA: TIGR03086 family metal-binding protein [Jatrophihabitantaceae bacterium]|jgi:uncharacterized protein (TIGR03086 family)
MSDVVALLHAGAAEFGTRVHRVEDWSAATPCSEWDVNALVDHLIDEHLWLPPLLAGHGLDAAGKIVESQKHSLAGDRVAAWDAAVLASGRAIDEPGAIDRQVTLSRGPTPAAEYLGEMIVDAAVHAWDLGRAIGVDEPLPADLVEFAMPMAQQFAGSEPYFRAPVEPPADATPQERLIALTGRNPR